MVRFLFVSLLAYYRMSLVDISYRTLYLIGSHSVSMLYRC